MNKSKMLSSEAISDIRNLSEHEIHELLELDEYSFEYQDLITVDNPDMKESDLSDFYNQFEKDPTNEFELAKIIYKSLPMSREQASNNRYWMYLNLKYFYRYIKERWIIRSRDIEEVTSKNFFDAFLISQPSQNTLMRAPISGLWWAVHLTIDSSSESQFDYTKIYFSDRNLRDKNLGAHQIIRDSNTLKALLEFYEKNKGEIYNNEPIGSEAIAQHMTKMLNQIGGLTLLSFLTKKEILNKLNTYKSTVLERAYVLKGRKVRSREKIEKEINKDTIPAEVRDPYSLKVAEPEPLVTHPTKVRSDRKPLKVLSLNQQGVYKVADEKDSTFDYFAEFYPEDKEGHLLMCYEEGYINRVTVESLLRRNRDLYQNGLYYDGKTEEHYNLSNLFVVNKPMLIGIKYTVKGDKHFKMHESNSFKDNNETMRLQGYKSLYMNFDVGSVRYYLLPYHLKQDIKRLFKISLTANGVKVKNPGFQKEFTLLREYVSL